MVKTLQEIFRQASYLFDYSIVAMDSSFFIFGGYYNYNGLNTIASFDTNRKQWKKLGQLNQARRGHGVIIQEGQFLVVGGGQLRSFGTERCQLNDRSIQCTTVEPKLSGYYYYPELMSVPANFCPK